MQNDAEPSLSSVCDNENNGGKACKHQKIGTIVEKNITRWCVDSFVIISHSQFHWVGTRVRGPKCSGGRARPGVLPGFSQDFVGGKSEAFHLPTLLARTLGRRCMGRWRRRGWHHKNRLLGIAMDRVRVDPFAPVTGASETYLSSSGTCMCK